MDSNNIGNSTFRAPYPVAIECSSGKRHRSRQAFSTICGILPPGISIGDASSSQPCQPHIHRISCEEPLRGSYRTGRLVRLREEDLSAAHGSQGRWLGPWQSPYGRNTAVPRPDFALRAYRSQCEPTHDKVQASPFPGFQEQGDFAAINEDEERASETCAVERWESTRRVRKAFPWHVTTTSARVQLGTKYTQARVRSTLLF